MITVHTEKGEKNDIGIPEKETIDLTPYLNGTEVIKEE